MLKLFFSGLIVGSLVLLLTSSSYFMVFGVLMQAVKFSLILSLLGCPFFGLLIMLMYMGGLLIVFLFSTMLSAEKHPRLKFSEIFLFWLGLILLFFSFLKGESVSFILSSFNLKSLKGEISFGELFGVLSWFTLGMGVFLLMALISIISMNFEHSRTSVRHI